MRCDVPIERKPSVLHRADGTSARRRKHGDLTVYKHAQIGKMLPRFIVRNDFYNGDFPPHGRKDQGHIFSFFEVRISELTSLKIVRTRLSALVRHCELHGYDIIFSARLSTVCTDFFEIF